MIVERKTISLSSEIFSALGSDTCDNHNIKATGQGRDVLVRIYDLLEVVKY